MKSIALVGLRLLGVLGVLTAGTLPAQSAVNAARQSELMREWQTTADSAGLNALANRTNTFGETGARALLDVVQDRTFPELTRVYATWSLEGYFQRLATCDGPMVFAAQRPDVYADAPCPQSAPLLLPTLVLDSLAPSNALRVFSIDPSLRDTIRVHLRAVVASGHGPAVEVASDILDHRSFIERWRPETHRACLRFAQARAAATDAFRALPLGNNQYLWYCTETGPTEYASLWRRVGVDSAFLAMLTEESSALRDRRLLNVMLTTAADAKRPLPVRMAAMVSIGAQLNQGVALTAMQRLSSMEFSTPLECIMPTGPVRFTLTQEDGAEPLRATDAQAGLRALRTLAARDRNPVIARDAGRLADCVETIERRVRRSVGG